MKSSWFYLLFLGLFSAPIDSYAQETTSYSRPQVLNPDPIYVLNSSVIINGVIADFTAQETKEIKKVTVYKGVGAPGAQDIAPHLKNLGVGVFDITSSRPVPSQSFAELGRQLGLHGPLAFALNGHTLDAQAVAALRIAPAAIGQLHIVQPTAELPETRVDIWLVAPPKPDYSKYPPGTVFLR